VAPWPRKAAQGHARWASPEGFAISVAKALESYAPGFLARAVAQPSRPLSASGAAADAFLMQIGCASCSPVRAMRILHPADPPSWRNHGTSHDLPKLGVAGSNLCPPLRKKPRFREVAEPGLLLSGALGGGDALGDAKRQRFPGADARLCPGGSPRRGHRAERDSNP